jgi:hypothetical protein
MAVSNGVDLALVVAGSVADSPERAGAVEAEGEVVVVRAGDGEQAPDVVKNRWRTARSEVSRLFGLMALNQLRLALLSQED